MSLAIAVINSTLMLLDRTMSEGQVNKICAGSDTIVS